MPIQQITTGIIQDGAIVATDIANGTVTGPKLGANSVSSNNIVSVLGSAITSNTVANSAFQTGSVENYLRGANLDFGMRNRIINGAMRIDQRNAGAVVTAGSDGAFPVDRWFAVEDTDGVMTAEQVEDAPTGFINSVKLITTTADTNLITTQSAQFMQNIEGLNVYDLGFGSASAKTVTLSFWVKSSLTGLMGGSLRNDAANRSYPFSYTISVADTWEYKTVTIAGDTSGTWLTNNNIGIRLVFSLGSGPSRLGTAGAWNANNNVGPTGEVPVIGTLNATWFLTGCQLEVGTQATSFEYRQYGTELALCQRYFEKCQDMSVVPGSTTNPGLHYLLVCAAALTANYGNTVSYQVRKRATPTFTYWDSTGTVNRVSFDVGGPGQTVTTAFNGETRILVYAASVANPGAIAFFWSASAEI